MQRDSIPDKKSFFVVAIGTSAGGLEALEHFFRNVSKNSGMAYIVVQHLSPDFKSLMDQLLARETDIPILPISDQLEIEPDHIYLLPPKKEAIVSGGRFVVTDRPPQNHLTFPIDELFRSVAQDAGNSAVAVILSGTGTDGSRGILDVHASGGLVVVESETTASFNGMPRSAFETGIVDHVLPVHEIPETILRHTQIPRSEQVEVGLMDSNLLDDSMSKILEILKLAFHIDFSNYKMTTICRRIERRLNLTNSIGIEQYADLLSKDRREVEKLYEDLLIGVTGFFRDASVFERLEIEIIPELIERLSDGAELRVWSIACATGEEAYSLAILIRECIEAMGRDLSVKIFASDMHRGSLAVASRGLYQRESLEGVSPERLKRFFVKRADGYHVSAEIRKMVVFTPHNCITDAPFTKLDLVTCRNLLIYLTSSTQRRVLSLIHFGLKPESILCLGSSETPGDLENEFLAIDERARIYRKHRDIRLPVNMRAPKGKIPLHTAVSPSLKPPMFSGFVPSTELLSTYDRLLEEYIPAGFLVNEKRELLQSFAGAGAFLDIPDGRISSDILEIIHGDLRSSLGAAIRRVNKDLEPVEFQSIPVSLPEGDCVVDLTVRPFTEHNGRRNFLVGIVRQDRTADALTPKKIDASDISGEEYESLERELEQTKDHLQSTIEELQSTNEELQAANEQLTAANEELQSTNEELHSVNEELYTVNAEHQRKIDELTQLTDDMDNLLNSTNVHTIFLDTDLCIRQFTPGIAKSFNLIPQDVGRRFDSFTHRIQDGNLGDEAKKVLDSGSPVEYEVCDVSGDWFLLRILPYRARGEIGGVVITLIDINKLKRIQSQLEQLSEIVEHSEDAIYRVNLDGMIETWNVGAKKLYGYDPEDIIGEDVSILFPEGTQSEATDFLDRLRQGISVDRIETRRSRINGTLVDVSITASPIVDDRGGNTGASVIARDITTQKHAEREIRDAVKRRDQFLAMLSHELRNPLAAILNATSLLKEERLDADTAGEAREVVEHQLQHVARMLDDLLDVSRITNGKLALQKEVINLTSLMADVVDCVQHQLDEKSQQLHVVEPLDDIFVEGDIGRLQQAQVNLLINASKYTEEGRSIWYDLRQVRDQAVVTVRDQGEGISPLLLPKIFEPFVQADQTIERSQGGMGLGLPLVRMIIEAHDGVVSAESEGPGRGSGFTIQIPVTKKSPTQASNLDSFSPGGRKLLLIEDNEGIRKMLARSLELKGFEIASASDGSNGLEMFLEFEPDTAVVDVGLPDIDGYQIATRIRSDAKFDSVLLVAVTGYGRAEDVEKAMNAGFDLHLVKPVNPDELLRRIGELEQNKSTAGKN